MKKKSFSGLIKIFSIFVILSLVLAACAPADFLSGTGGEGEENPPAEEVTEAPVEEATEEAPVEEATEAPPPVEEATEAPVEEATEAPPPVEEATEAPPPVEEATEAPPPVEEATEAPTEAPPPTEAPTEAPAEVLPPTDSPTEAPIPTDTSAPTEEPAVVNTPTFTLTPTPTQAATSTPKPSATPTKSSSSGAGPAGVAVVPTSTNTSTPTNTPVPTKTNTPLPTNTKAPDPFVGLGVACNNDLSATFTIANDGGQLSGGTYTVTEPGKAAASFPLNLASGQSVSFAAAGNASVTVIYSTSELETVNLFAQGTCLPLPENTPTHTPTATKTATPSKTATASKTPTLTNTPGPSPTPTNTNTPKPTNTPTSTFTPTFTITPGPSPTPTNTKTPKPTNTPRPTRTPSNTPTITNTPAPTNTPTITYTPSPTFTPTLTNTPVPTNTPVDGQLDLKVYCNTDLSATFVIRNVSGSVSDGTYTMSDPAESGQVDLQPGQSTSIKGAGYATMTVTYRTTFLSSVTLSVTGFCAKRPTATPTNTPTNTPENTATPTPTHTPTSTPTTNPSAPSLKATATCSGVNKGVATFTITNTGGDMDKPFTYVITDGQESELQTAFFQLAAGESVVITIEGTAPSYMIFSPDAPDLSAVADMTKCIVTPTPTTPPSLSLDSSGSCTAIGVATFVVTNNGSDMTTPYTYNITDASGAVVQTSTFDLDAGESTTITVNGNSTSYTLTSPNDSSLTAQADMTICVEPPVEPDLTATGVCTSNDGIATFVITNNGGDMTTPYTYNITDADGNVVQTNTILLTAGQSITLTVTGTSTSYTLTSPNDSSLTTLADMTTCVEPPPPPDLTATGVCTENDGVATFVITNNGGDMTVDYVYTITDTDGNVIQTGTFQLASGETLDLVISGSYDGLILTLTDANNTTARVAMTECTEPIVSVAPAEPQPCIQCLVFHTFRDNNLEVYRLDGIEGQPDAKLYNLSKDGAVDSRPSRAPNDSWVVFQSNRNGNVELYYTDLLGSGNAVRLTETNSNNTNPMYGPDARTIVFQSDRNGRFDLFTIDQQTGKETQITSNPADDVNAFYSPDLKWLVFQSNRNNNWDLFLINVETGNEFRLTNSPADEVFPAWSPNGKQVAFLLDEDGKTDLYVIDVDGQNLKRLTTDGKTVNAVWSHEGSRIAYQSERDGNLDIYSFDFTNNKEYRVTDYEGPDSGPTWDCGSTNLAFTSTRDGDPNIFQVFWQGGAAGNMTIDPATDKWSQWRPTNDVSSVGY